MYNSTTALEQALVGGFARDLHDALVGVGAGHQHLDLHAALGRLAQEVDEDGIGREVGGGDAQAPLGHLHEGPQQDGHVGPTDARAASDDLDGRGAGLLVVQELLVVE